MRYRGVWKAAKVYEGGAVLSAYIVVIHSPVLNIRAWIRGHDFKA
jgi:hypothetical protein